MPYIINGVRKGGRALVAAAGVALVCAAPAAAGAPKPGSYAYNPDNCVVDNVLSNPFSALGDLADYALAPGGDFETGADGWTLNKAAVVSGNQPFDIGAPGESSLDLPPGSSATSAKMCIDSTYPHFKLFARNKSGGKEGLKVEVLYYDAKGKLKATSSSTLTSSSTSWFLSDSLNVGVTFNEAVADAAAPVKFRFSAGKAGDWQIDDVYVDPYMRR